MGSCSSPDSTVLPWSKAGILRNYWPYIDVPPAAGCWKLSHLLSYWKQNVQHDGKGHWISGGDPAQSVQRSSKSALVRSSQTEAAMEPVIWFPFNKSSVSREKSPGEISGTVPSRELLSRNMSLNIAAFPQFSGKVEPNWLLLKYRKRKFCRSNIELGRLPVNKLAEKSTKSSELKLSKSSRIDPDCANRADNEGVRF